MRSLALVREASHSMSPPAVVVQDSGERDLLRPAAGDLDAAGVLRPGQPGVGCARGSLPARLREPSLLFCLQLRTHTSYLAFDSTGCSCLMTKMQAGTFNVPEAYRRELCVLSARQTLCLYRLAGWLMKCSIVTPGASALLPVLSVSSVSRALLGVLLL